MSKKERSPTASPKEAEPAPAPQKQKVGASKASPEEAEPAPQKQKVGASPDDHELSPLTAVSPLDGRYRSKIGCLSPYFSEYALIRYRVKIEVEYILALTKVVPSLKAFPAEKHDQLRSIYDPKNFTLAEANKIKDTEAVTNHDVKAVEYYVKDHFDKLRLSTFKEWVHFALTSQDINNTSFPLLLKDSLQDVYFPALHKILDTTKKLATDWMNVAMLARTHGQPATPTRLGKELQVFHYRATQQLNLLKQIPHSAKFGGATGQFNAHVVAMSLDHVEGGWLGFADQFVSGLGLVREQWTTQISNYDNLGALLDSIKRINIVFLDYCKDMWQYISMEYFKQKIRTGEIGSSAMPHKVNPIDFENAEGNFGIANALFEHMSSKLPISRLQRDLTDSTVLRNLGVPIAHTVLAFSSLQRGLEKLILNEEAINQDLKDNYIVVSEAIQTVLRREEFEKPYEKVKELTRTGKEVNQTQFDTFVDGLEGASDSLKAELKQITPWSFIGVVPKQ